jgi:hypothetical protein
VIPPEELEEWLAVDDMAKALEIAQQRGWITNPDVAGGTADLDAELDAHRAAGAERGPIVGRVYCGICGGKSQPIGVVRRTSHGLLLEAGFIHRQIRDLTAEDRQPGAPQTRVPMNTRRSLIERDLSEWFLPRVECPTHGVIPAPSDVLIAAVRKPGKAARIFLG